MWTHALPVRLVPAIKTLAEGCSDVWWKTLQYSHTEKKRSGKKKKEKVLHLWKLWRSWEAQCEVAQRLQDQLLPLLLHSKGNTAGRSKEEQQLWVRTFYFYLKVKASKDKTGIKTSNTLSTCNQLSYLPQRHLWSQLGWGHRTMSQLKWQPDISCGQNLETRCPGEDAERSKGSVM